MERAILAGRAPSVLPLESINWCLQAYMWDLKRICLSTGVDHVPINAQTSSAGDAVVIQHVRGNFETFCRLVASQYTISHSSAITQSLEHYTPAAESVRIQTFTLTLPFLSTLAITGPAHKIADGFLYEASTTTPKLVRLGR